MRRYARDSVAKIYNATLVNTCTTEKNDIANWIDENISPDCKHGTIAFRGLTRNSMAKFIKIPIPDVNERLDKVYKLMTEQWKIEKPSLIVSVTGTYPILHIPS